MVLLCKDFISLYQVNDILTSYYSSFLFIFWIDLTSIFSKWGRTVFLFHSRVRPASGDTKVKGDSRIGLGPVWLRGIRIGPSLYKISGCGDTLPQEMTDISLIISLETNSVIRYHSQYFLLSFMFRFIVLILSFISVLIFTVSINCFM